MDPLLSEQRSTGAQLGAGGSPSAAEFRPPCFTPDAFSFPVRIRALCNSSQQALARTERIRRERNWTSPRLMASPFIWPRSSSKAIRIVPLTGEALPEFNRDRIFEMVAEAAQPVAISEKRVMTEYDAYYLDRHRARPLPVLFIKLNDPEHSQFYIGPSDCTHSGAALGRRLARFTNRWLYHALHSLDFPLLYNHRPAWDIVVLTLMLGGLTLCLTSVIIGWQVLRRKLS